MFDTLTRLIAQALAPHETELLRLNARLDSLQRQTRNQLQPATVIEIAADGQHVRLQAGELRSPMIRWFAPAAGAIHEYRCPSLGEQCVLLNFGGGEDSSQSWALCGIWSDAHPLPDNRPHIHSLHYPDGSCIEHNCVTGDHRLKISGDLILDIEGRIIETATQHLASKR